MRAHIVCIFSIFSAEESSQIGYIFSMQDTQEVIQTDSSSWGSDRGLDEGVSQFHFPAFCRTSLNCVFSKGPERHNWNDGFEEISSRLNLLTKSSPASGRLVGAQNTNHADQSYGRKDSGLRGLDDSDGRLSSGGSHFWPADHFR